MNKLVTLWAACLVLISAPAFAQYSQAAGQNAPTVREVQRHLDAKTGKMEVRTVDVQATKDRHGNAQGNQFDLAVTRMP